jgi:GT2 family glycosyltransferase
MSFLLSACIVIYKNDKYVLSKAIHSFLNTELNVKLFLIDNSPTDELRSLVIDFRIDYYHNPSNPGFGAAHNVGLQKATAFGARYHLVLNPDIYYSSGVIEGIIEFMGSNNNIGLVMPKVLYPDGSIQYLAKLIPSPFVFFVRRFLPISIIKEKISNKFELRFSDYEKIMEVPYLSGCFMFFRTNVLQELNGFDEKIFMHMEDLDISRRCYEAGYKTLYFPYQVVYHDHSYKTFLSFANLKMYFTSAFYYFNKWGWFFDKERSKINKKIIQQIIENKYL